MAKKSFYYAPHGQKNPKKRTSVARKPKNSMVKSHGRSHKSHGNNSVVEKSSMKRDHVNHYENHRHLEKKSIYYQAFFILRSPHATPMQDFETYTSVGIM